MTTTSHYAYPIVQPIDLSLSPESAVVSFSLATAPSILESSFQGLPYARYSIFACDPVNEVVVNRLQGSCPFQALADRWVGYPVMKGPMDGPTSLPFTGGWIGFITYEAGLAIEKIPCTKESDPFLPSARFCLYDAAALYDHSTKRWYLTAVDWPRPFARYRPSVDQRLASLRTRLEEARSLDTTGPLPDVLSSVPEPNMAYHEYLTKVHQAKRYIEAGDVYQVNLTQRFTVQTDATPLTLYRRLRRGSPSSHAALIPWGDTAILSSSPELFLHLHAGRVVTRPIKGTRPRGIDHPTDDACRRELTDSEKDRAELTMIIDLLRNDLGRVCSFGTVQVSRPGDLEAHPTVFHCTATIEGTLPADRSWLDLLRATFPGGSVTGAPKIRAMQIIDELEPTPRGVYCGSIGFIGLDGSMSLNLAIRTMVQRRDTVHLYAGGAIVADSEPEQEYEEIMAKAAGMFRAVECRGERMNHRIDRVMSRRRQEVPIS